MKRNRNLRESFSLRTATKVQMSARATHERKKLEEVDFFSHAFRENWKCLGGKGKENNN